VWNDFKFIAFFENYIILKRSVSKLTN